MFYRRFVKGFTALELLIVLAVFGLLVTLAVLSLNSARARTRDAQRLSDVSVLRNGLSQYYSEKATYPVSTDLYLAQPGAKADKLTSDGFSASQDAHPPIYLDRVPMGPTANEYYHYHGGPNGYSLRFKTESDTLLGKANVFYAHASGIDSADEEK